MSHFLMLIFGAKIQTFLLCMINVARFARNIMRLLEGFFTTVSVASYGISDPDPLWNFRDNYFG